MTAKTIAKITITISTLTWVAMIAMGKFNPISVVGATIAIGFSAYVLYNCYMREAEEKDDDL